MTQRNLHFLDKSLTDAYAWLDEIAAELHGSDRQSAYHAFRGVMLAVRDRLGVDEALQLSAQLPVLIRGMFLEGYRAVGKPLKIRDRQEFLDLVCRELDATGDEGRVLDAFRAVVAVLRRHVTAGELRQVRNAMPHAVRELWPEETSQV